MNTNDIKQSHDRHLEKENKLVYSYMTLRNLIGLCGLVLPFALILATRVSITDQYVRSSISDYYYTSSGDILVVVLSVLGVFLFTYKGYNFLENILSTLAAIAGVGVAFSPTASKSLNESFSVHTFHPEVPAVFGVERHFLFAASFFIMLSLIALIYFPKSDKGKKEEHKLTQKIRRNRVYRICGWTMLGSMAVLAVYILSDKFHGALGGFPFIFTCETVAIEA